MAEREESIVFSSTLRARLVATVRARFPAKSFGYLLSDGDERTPTNFVIFDGNSRNDVAWKPEFEAFGRYFIDHDDAGFVAPAEESWTVQKQIWERGMVEVGAFHSHRRHPANFSEIDYALHLQRFRSLWHLIISMRNPDLPQLRAFAVSSERVRELRLVEDRTGASVA